VCPGPCVAPPAHPGGRGTGTHSPGPGGGGSLLVASTCRGGELASEDSPEIGMVTVVNYTYSTRSVNTQGVLTLQGYSGIVMRENDP